MRPEAFDYDNYHRKCEIINKRVKGFKEGKYLPVCQYTYGEGVYSNKCQYRDISLQLQLDAITKTLETESDWIPYLEPWNGIGIFAEAFGCPFEFSDNEAPWTRPIVFNIDQLKRLEKPELRKSGMLKYVLETTEYLNEQTKGELPIAATDTQSPFNTLTLICDTAFILTEAWDYREDVHRVLGYITDLIIEFTLEQRKLCNRIATPGHSMWSPDLLSGISISDDILAMVGPNFYKEFCVPCSERIAEALGGVVEHSCGKWAYNFDTVKEIKGLTMVDLAISKAHDPDPNCPGDIVKAFSGTGIPVQVRCDANDRELIDEIITSDVLAVLVPWWEKNPEMRQQQYYEMQRRWENLKAGRT